MTAKDQPDLTRFRVGCIRFPEAEESLLQDWPLFHVRRRRFAIYNGDNSPYRKRWAGFGRSLHFATDKSVLADLQSDSRFIVSPHHGPSGWLSIDLRKDSFDWSEVSELLFQAYRCAANRKLISGLNKDTSGHA